MKTPTVPMTPSINRMIVEEVRRLGIPAHLQGYEYIKQGLVLEDPSVLNSVTTSLYPKVAQEYGTTASRVERSIRHALEMALFRNATGYIEKLFRPYINPNTGKVTNSEFLAIVAETIRLELGVYDQEEVKND